MVTQKTDTFLGLILIAEFIGILILLYLPIIENKTPITFLDDLYKSISKGAVYFIPALREKAKDFEKTNIDIFFVVMNDRQKEQFLQLLISSEINFEIIENQIHIRDNLFRIMQRILLDADEMSKNISEGIRNRYNTNEKEIIFNWWSLLNKIEFQLTKQKLIAAATFVSRVKEKVFIRQIIKRL
jgi:hypothetical protein